MLLRSARAVALVGLMGLAMGASRGCADPTQVTVVLTTDVPCDRLRGVTIAVGGAGEDPAAPSTSTTSCDADGHLGTIVLVPRGARDSVLKVELVAGIDRQPEWCAAPSFGAGCIAARRVLSYIPQSPLVLPVAMRASCNGVVCTNDQTCVQGVCRDAKIGPNACGGAGCGEDVLGVPSASPCADGSVDCAGATPRQCVSGVWEALTACAAPATCQSGACFGSASISGYDLGACVTFGRGKTWCWGNNGGGILGDGTTSGVKPPTLVATARTHVQVAVTSNFACGRSADGVVECWGGPFGPTPTVVKAITEAEYLGGGQQHMCVVTATGQLYCWGLNGRSQASGDGKTVDIPFTTPALVPLPGPAAAVAGGLAGTCALLVSGRVRCWGLGGSGEIGVGSFSDQLTPDADALGLEDAVTIAGGFFGACVAVRNGDAYCWGRVPAGDGTSGNVTVPKKIATNVLAVGGTQAKGGCLLLSSGTPQCWNLQNQFGELGVGTFGTTSLVPVVVPGITTGAVIDSRADSAWVVLRDGSIRAWGNDENGQLGMVGQGPETIAQAPCRSCFRSRG